MESLDIQSSSSENRDSAKIYCDSEIAFSSEDFTRIIMQSLHNLGYGQIAETLERESGLHTRSSNVDNLFSAISSGDWISAINLVDNVEFVTKTVDDIKSMILELKYMEMIQSGDIVHALQCLREELRNVCDAKRLKTLSAYLLCGQSSQPLQSLLAPDFVLVTTRDGLLREIKPFISPTQVVGECRLESLVVQALRYQRIQAERVVTVLPSSSITSHAASRPTPQSLLEDYRLPTSADAKDSSGEDAESDLPQTELRVLRDHSDEVWCVSFSPCGRYLATGSADGTVRIWHDVTRVGAAPSSIVLEGLPKDAKPFKLSWSSFSNQLLCCCGGDAGVYRWEARRFPASDVFTCGQWNWEEAICMRYTYHEAAHREQGGEDSELGEVTSVEWVHLHRTEIPMEETEAGDDLFASLSDDFGLFLCTVEGDVCASYRGIGVASAMTVLPPSDVTVSSPAGPHTASSSATSMMASGSRFSRRNAPSPAGWRDVNVIRRNPSGDSTLSMEGDVDVDTSAASCVSPAVRTITSPTGYRFLVVRSEMYVELFELQDQPHLSAVTGNGSASSASSRRSSATEQYIFLAMLQFDYSMPIVALSSTFAHTHVEDEVAVLVSLLGGVVSTLLVQGNYDMSEGFKYEGAKQSRCVIVPAISDGGIGGAALLASGGDGAGVLLWRAGAQQPAVTLIGHAGPVNNVCFSPSERGVLASVSDDHSVRIWCTHRRMKKQTEAKSESGSRLSALEGDESKEEMAFMQDSPTRQLDIHHRMFLSGVTHENSIGCWFRRNNP